MKSQSSTEPERLVKSGGKTQFAYNIHKVIIKDPDNIPKTMFNYDYVEIEGVVTKAKILVALEAVELEIENNFVPSEVETQYNEAKEAINLSDITKLTYNQLDTYIDDNVTNLAAAKVYLKKLSKIVLAILKKDLMEKSIHYK